MGRKTWDSLPSAFKPLPNRLNLVLTTQAQWTAPGAVAVHSLRAAKEAHQAHRSSPTYVSAESESAIWVIGGAQVYAQTISEAHSIEMTQIDLKVQGDAFAPLLGQEWREMNRQEHTSLTGVRFRFLTMERF
jgi:dihydrofolate reductase